MLLGVRLLDSNLSDGFPQPRRLRTGRHGHAESMDFPLSAVRTCMFLSPTHAFEHERPPAVRGDLGRAVLAH